MQIRKLTPVSGIKRTLKQYNKISEKQIVTHSIIFIFCFGRIASVWSPIVTVGEYWSLYDFQRIVAIKVHKTNIYA